MGDRANVVIQEDGKRVYLYTHWQGHELPEIVRRALARNERWDDPPYLARIVFCEMVGGDKGTTGFGISTEIQDNSYPIIVINCDEQTIAGEADPRRKHATRGELRSHAIAKFAVQPSASWADFDTGRKDEEEDAA